MDGRGRDGDGVEPVTVVAPPLRGPALLDQRWRDLSFLHWRVEPGRVAPLLPAGVVPDVFDGSTWVGLIGFRLTDARLGPSPPLPWVGSFAETNVRFYGVDAAGRRGVVFGSLEAERLLFVLGARVALNLPYTWAAMSMRRDGDRWTYRSRRRWPGPRGARTRIEVESTDEAVDDPLTRFLTARWGLHTHHLGRTLFLPNQHQTWPLRRARLLALEDELVAAAGLPGVTDAPPESVLFSTGVHTRFGAPLPRPGVGQGGSPRAAEASRTDGAPRADGAARTDGAAGTDGAARTDRLSRPGGGSR